MAAKALEFAADAHTLCALIANDVGAGRIEEARATASRLVQLRPGFRASFARQYFPARSTEWGDRIALVLQQAGLPEEPGRVVFRMAAATSDRETSCARRGRGLPSESVIPRSH
ncbi:hypothetical protein JQ615_19550 [Bradyrhizobium jicamae]|uniref:Uncharacterized protein n=1 Tax=Bradyrhizobium jicamae TaxID=280332 RepID=A0ABS5FLB7_9BRAD|nr:hypothetical protein [Bradyrhizobium jicamae]MBR0797587.1 hypothetical protein [Bradyrhizobium jicamae]